MCLLSFQPKAERKVTFFGIFTVFLFVTKKVLWSLCNVVFKLCFLRFYADQAMLITSESHFKRPPCRIRSIHIMVFPGGPSNAYEQVSNLSGSRLLCLNVRVVFHMDLQTVMPQNTSCGVHLLSYSLVTATM